MNPKKKDCKITDEYRQLLEELGYDDDQICEYLNILIDNQMLVVIKEEEHHGRTGFVTYPASRPAFGLCFHATRKKAEEFAARQGWTVEDEFYDKQLVDYESRRRTIPEMVELIQDYSPCDFSVVKASPLQIINDYKSTGYITVNGCKIWMISFSTLGWLISSYRRCTEKYSKLEAGVCALVDHEVIPFTCFLREARTIAKHIIENDN